LDNDNSGSGRNDVLSIKPVSQDSILLIDRFGYKIFSYNTKTFQIEKRLNAVNYMIYEFSPDCLYYSAGHSIDLGFSVFKITQQTSTVLKKMPDNEGIFPLAQSDKYMFFIRCIYDKRSIEISRHIVKYDLENNTFEEFGNPEGLISYGAIIGEILYYTVYNERENNYTLFSVSCSDSTATVNKVKDNLEGGEIFSQGKTLYITDGSSIISENAKFKKESENYFIGSNILVQYQIQKNGDLSAIVTDTETGNRVYSAENIVDFAVSDSEITFYCVGAIKTFKFN